MVKALGGEGVRSFVETVKGGQATSPGIYYEVVGRFGKRREVIAIEAMRRPWKTMDSSVFTKMMVA